MRALPETAEPAETGAVLEPCDRPGPGGRAESWLIWLCVLSPLLYTLTATFVDGAVQVRDMQQNVVWVSNGNRAQMVTLASAGLLVLVSIHLLLSNLRNLARVPSWFLAAAVVTSIGGLYRVGQTSVQTLIMYLVAGIVLAAAGTVRVTPRTVAGIAWLLGGVAMTSLVHAAAQPSVAMSECRDDKCGIFGGLLHSYFPHENILGLAIIFLLPALGALRHHTARLVIALLALTAVLASGSRTALVAAPFAIAGTWFVHRWQQSVRMGEAPRGSGLARLVLGYFPLLTFALSAVLIFALPPGALTGRGMVYEIIRANLREHPFLGPGSEILQRTYEQSGSLWLIVHEHSQAGHLLTTAGILGFLVMTVALVRMGLVVSETTYPVAGAFALAPALGFLSEPTWEMSPRSYFFWTMVITLALLKSMPARASTPEDDGPSAPTADLGPSRVAEDGRAGPPVA